MARFSRAKACGIQTRLGCSSLKCGLQKSARRIFVGSVVEPSGSSANRSSAAGTEALLDGSVAGDAKRTGARYLRPALRPGEACRSSALARDTEHDGRRPGAFAVPSLTRMVPARPWLGRSSSGASAGLRSRSSRRRSSAGGRVGIDLAVPCGRHEGVRGLSDTGKAHPAVEARWVGPRLGAWKHALFEASSLLSPKLARANTSATSPGSSQRELCGPIDRNPH
jgi:hypothetical protein